MTDKTKSNSWNCKKTDAMLRTLSANGINYGVFNFEVLNEIVNSLLQTARKEAIKEAIKIVTEPSIFLTKGDDIDLEPKFKVIRHELRRELRQKLQSLLK